VAGSTNNSNTPLLHGQTVIVSGNGGPTVAFTVAKNSQWTTTNVGRTRISRCVSQTA
jgi:hypothetical protein